MKNIRRLKSLFFNYIFQFQTVASDKSIPYYEVKQLVLTLPPKYQFWFFMLILHCQGFCYVTIVFRVV